MRAADLELERPHLFAKQSKEIDSYELSDVARIAIE